MTMARRACADLGERAQHVVERVAHIGAVRGGEVRRESRRAGRGSWRGRCGARRHGAEHRVDRLAVGLEAARRPGRRARAGARPQSWPSRVEIIGRRADARARHDQLAVRPGRRAVRHHTDGEVEIEPDPQARLARPALAHREAGGRQAIAARHGSRRAPSAPRRRRARSRCPGGGIPPASRASRGRGRCAPSPPTAPRTARADKAAVRAGADETVRSPRARRLRRAPGKCGRARRAPSPSASPTCG